MNRVFRYLALGLLLAFVFRADSFFYGRGIDPDEGLALLQGRALCEGYLPYTKYFEHRQPLMYANFALGQLLFGERVVSCRIWVALLVGFSSAFAGLIARRLTENRAASVVAMFTLAACSALTTGITAVSELLVIPWTLLAVLIALHAPSARGPMRFVLAALAGVAIGTGAMVKLLAAFDMPAVWIAMGITITRSGRPLRSLLPMALTSGAAALIPTAIVGGIYALDGHWQRFVYCCFTYNRLYAAAVELHPRLLLRFLGTTALALVAIWPLAVLACLGARDRDQRSAHLLAGVWFCTSLAAACATRRFFPHYMLMVLPAVAVVAALGWHARRGLSPSLRRLTLVAIGIGAVVMGIQRVTQFWMQVDEHRDSVDLEQRVAKLVKPGDITFFANNDPILYYATRTEPATALVFPMWLGDADWRAALGVKLEPELRSILARKPTLIVLRHTRGGWENKVITTFEKMTRVNYRVQKQTSRVTYFVPRGAATQPASAPSLP